MSVASRLQITRWQCRQDHVDAGGGERLSHGSGVREKAAAVGTDPGDMGGTRRVDNDVDPLAAARIINTFATR